MLTSTAVISKNFPRLCMTIFAQERSVLVFPREGLVQSILTGKSGRGEAPKPQPGVAKAQAITGMWMQYQNLWEFDVLFKKKAMSTPCGLEYLLLINRYCSSGVSADNCLWGPVCEAFRRICNKQFSPKKVLCGVCLYGWSQNVFMFQHSCCSKLLFWSAVEMELFICFNVFKWYSCLVFLWNVP